jgi:predicted dehydrogenase
VTPLRVGLAGYGMAGQLIHGPLLRACPGLVVTGVVTRNDERAAGARKDHPDATVYPDVAALLGADPRPDVVVVATTNETHAAVVTAAVDAGCAVVVDKPLAVDSVTAAALVARAAERGVPLTVFQNRRLDSDQRTLARLLRDGELGRVFRHESRFERWRPALDPARWRERLPAESGGGQLLDLGSHLVDQSVQLFGPVQQVYAEIGALRGGADDAVFLALRHGTGVASHLSLGAVFAAPGPRRRVLGDRGAYLVDRLDAQEDQLRVGLDPADGSFGVEPGHGLLVRGDTAEPVPSEPGGWSEFYPAVVAAVRGDGPVPVDPADAVAVLQVLEAARTASAEGRVVTLPAA